MGLDFLADVGLPLFKQIDVIADSFLPLPFKRIHHLFSDGLDVNTIIQHHSFRADLGVVAIQENAASFGE